MSGRPSPGTPAIATRQAGVFTTEQAIAAGMSRHQVARRLASGAWQRVAGDALASGTLPVDAWIQVHAAWLTWPDVVVCFGTAARLFRLPVPDDGLVHVVAPGARRHRDGLAVHVLPVDDRDVEPAGWGRVTTRERTIIDCIGRLPPKEADHLVAWVLSRRLLTGAALSDWVERHPGAWGNDRRRIAIRQLLGGVASPAEALLHRLLRTAKVTGWVAGESLISHVGVAASADVYFPDVRLVIEVDGRAFHGSDRFQADRTRQNNLVMAGCTVLRFTWEDLTARPAQVVAQVRRTLTLLRAGR